MMSVLIFGMTIPLNEKMGIIRHTLSNIAKTNNNLRSTNTNLKINSHQLSQNTKDVWTSAHDEMMKGKLVSSAFSESTIFRHDISQ